MNILPSSQPSDSIFDSIRHFDEQGNEFWLATELLANLGYTSWKRIKDTVERAKVSTLNSKADIASHFADVVQMAQIGGSQAFREVIKDFKLSRYACYLVAMNGDPRKTEIAMAQSYFVAKTREAETVIPAQSEALRLAELRIKELEMQNTALDKQLALRHLDNSMLTLHGAPTVLALRGMIDQVVEIEKPTIEVIDEKSGAQFKGMTLAKLNEFVSNKHGIKHKSGAEIARFLDQKGYGHLIGQVPRRQLTDYVPEENIAEVVRLLISDHKQLLLGE